MSTGVFSAGSTFDVWRPLPNINDRFVIRSIRDGVEGFFVTLASETERLLRIDVASPLAYRWQFRDLNPPLWTEFEQQASQAGAFWKASKSDWIDSLKPQPGLVSSNLQHYLVFSTDAVVEFLTDEVPHLSWLDNFFGDAV